MVPSLLQMFVSVSVLIACVDSQAESAGDPRRLSTSIVTTSTDAGQRDFYFQLKEALQAVQNLGGVILKKYLDNIILKDCSEAPISGVYTIQLDCNNPFKVYCDMETDGGGWTVFQRRKDGTVDFYRNFSDYSRGFGDPEGEFWLGNQNLHLLTADNEYELRVDLVDFEGHSTYAVYDSFRVGDLADNYTLTVGGYDYSGTAVDGLSYHNGMPFTTKDRDNDQSKTGNCARFYRGAWWYRLCYRSNLNGEYLGKVENSNGIEWRNWTQRTYLKTTEMKIRMRN